MKRLPFITVLLLACPVLGDAPPPPAVPPTPSDAAVMAGGADEDELVDVEPLPVIEAPAQAIAGTIVKITAHGSRNAHNYAWLVMPPLPCEVSADGKTCMFAHPKAGKFTFILAVSTARGKVALTTAVVTLNRIEDEDESPAIVRALAAPAPARDAVKALTAAVRKTSLEDRVRVVSGLRMLAAGLLQGAIRGDDEYTRAVAEHLGKLNAPALVDAALAAAEQLAGDTEDVTIEGNAVHRVATVIEGVK